MELESLRDLYLDELRDLYSAEQQIVKALPKMSKAASNPQLKKAFDRHLRVTEKQVQRLERIFKDIDESPRGKKCVGMEGLIKEAQELIKEKPEADVLDAGLISKAQHVEHYEMAGYGTVRTWAQLLGEQKHADLLQQTLDEEGEADKSLTQLAESSINVEATEGEVGVAGTSRGTRTRSTSRARGGRTEREVSRPLATESPAMAGGGSSRVGSSRSESGQSVEP